MALSHFDSFFVQEEEDAEHHFSSFVRFEWHRIEQTTEVRTHATLLASEKKPFLVDARLHFLLVAPCEVTCSLAPSTESVTHNVFTPPFFKHDNAALARLCHGRLMAPVNSQFPVVIHKVSRKHSSPESPAIMSDIASIQLIPVTAAALRSAHGSDSPMEILPAVLVTSVCSAVVGIVTASILFSEEK